MSSPVPPGGSEEMPGGLGTDRPQQAEPGSIPRQPRPSRALPEYQTPYGPSKLPPRDRLGSWIRRVFAHLVDWLVGIIPATILGAIYNLLVSPSSRVIVDDGRATPDSTSPSAAAWTTSIVLTLLTLGIIIWNRWWRGGRTGQTLGKQALGLMMVGERDGRPIGAGMAFVRDVLHILDTLALMLGWLWPLWDNKRQTFADKIAGTLVFRT